MLSDGLKTQVEKLIRDGGMSQRVAIRCRVILLAHQGETNVAIAGQLGLSRPTVLAARSAFAKNGVKALTDVRKRKRSSRVLTAELELRILDVTLKTRPLDPLECAHLGEASWSAADDRPSRLAKA